MNQYAFSHFSVENKLAEKAGLFYSEKNKKFDTGRSMAYVRLNKYVQYTNGVREKKTYDPVPVMVFAEQGKLKIFPLYIAETGHVHCSANPLDEIFLTESAARDHDSLVVYFNFKSPKAVLV